jgi:glyoxylase-like metal-dependent hydrolase (beta-lactamase superfamily II)
MLVSMSLGHSSSTRLTRFFLFASFVVGWAPAPAQTHAQPPKAPRLYVFDCGRIKVHFKKEELANVDFVVTCFLVAHPKGTLMWDVGVIPDSAFKAGGAPVTQDVSTVTKPLKPQLAAVGYVPADITFLALSHYHLDHTANANDFAGATWLVRKAERDAMFAEKPPAIVEPASFSALRDSKTVILTGDEYDVFGDGTVIIKSAPGHTPGHQVLFLKLAKTGPVIVGGDLYHYPEERTTGRTPSFEFNAEQSTATRAAIEAFIKKTGAQFWIEHDIATYSKLKKAPDYYE